MLVSNVLKNHILIPFIEIDDFNPTVRKLVYVRIMVHFRYLPLTIYCSADVNIDLTRDQ